MTAYIWDLDGTLLDSYEMIVEAAARTAAEEGIYDSKEHVLKAVKQGAVTAYMEEISEQCGKTVKELFGRYREHTHALDDRIKLIDGAKETLEGLQKAGAAHFVYTHRGSSSGPILERIDIQKSVAHVDYFDLNEQKSSYTSAQLRERVEKARKIHVP